MLYPSINDHLQVLRDTRALFFRVSAAEWDGLLEMGYSWVLG
jgi:hypothetical protein